MRRGLVPAAWVLVFLLGACDLVVPGRSGTSDPDPEAARTALEQQRSDVRATARRLVHGAEKALPGHATEDTVRWDGCESGGPEEFASFRYVAMARIAVRGRAGAEGPHLRPLRGLLEDAGLTAGRVQQGRGDARSLAGGSDRVRATFVDTGYTAGGPFIGLEVTGPCIDVPGDQSDEWLRKDPGSGVA